jgi:hypothetical protein
MRRALSQIMTSELLRVTLVARARACRRRVPLQAACEEERLTERALLERRKS